MNLPRIVVLTTGGTIASAGASATDTATYGLSSEAPDLLAAVPEIARVARARCEPFANLISSELTLDDLLALARRVAGLLAAPEVDGVVVTHGTDTLEETAYFLHLTLKSEKACVLVGAARPGTALSADGPLNLYQAVRVAGFPAARGLGVLAVGNDRIACARDVTKVHASAPDCFGSGDHGALGRLAGDLVEIDRAPLKAHTRATPFALEEIETLPEVAIVPTALGLGTGAFEAALASGAAGIVVAATGNGSLTGALKAAAARARDAGVAVVRASRTNGGAVTSQPYDAEYGTIAAGSLNPQKARILLMLALTVTRDLGAVRRLFETH